MKLLRIVRNVVLLVLALCLCAVLALAFLGWQMYTQALEEMPLIKRCGRCGLRKATPLLRSCQIPMCRRLSLRRTTGFTNTLGWM